VQKSPKGAAGLAQQVRKNRSPPRGLSVHKSPKGAAGLAQQVRKNRSPPRGLSVQKSPKGAAGLAQQVRKNRSPPRGLSVQKSPKGAAGLAQQVRKDRSLQRRLTAQKSPKGAAGLSTTNTEKPLQNIPDKAHNAFAGTGKRGHTTSSYKPLHIYKRGHTTSSYKPLHRLNLRNNSHIPIIKQHYPKLLTRKKTSQFPFPCTRGGRQRQQFLPTS
jgi:hypothetical protein